MKRSKNIINSSERIKRSTNHITTLNTLYRNEAKTITNNSSIQKNISVKTFVNKSNNTSKPSYTTPNAISESVNKSSNVKAPIYTIPKNNIIDNNAYVRAKVQNSNVMRTEERVKKGEQHITTLNTLHKNEARTLVNSSTITRKINVVQAKAKINRVNSSPNIARNSHSNISNNPHLNIVTNSSMRDNNKARVNHISTINTLQRNNSNKYGIQRQIRNTIKNNTSNLNDNTSSIATAIVATEVGVSVFKASQKASDILWKKSKNGYNIAGKTIKVSKGAINHIKSGDLKLNHQTYLQLKSLALYKAKQSNIALRINHKVAPIKTAYNGAINLTRKTKYMYLSSKTKLNVIRGITDKSFKLQVSRSMLNDLKNKGIKAIGKSSAYIGRGIKTGAKHGLKTGGKITKKSIRGVKRGILKAGDILIAQDDFATQSVGFAIKGTNMTIKGGKLAIAGAKKGKRTVKTAINVPIKTTKNIKKFIKTTKKFGIKTTMRWQKNRAMKSLKKAGGSVVNKIVQLVGKRIKKGLVPIIIIVILIFTVANSITLAGAGVNQTLFGSTISDKDTGKDIDETEWLTQKITQSRKDLINQVKNIYNSSQKANGGSYDFVRLYNSISSQEIDLTDTNILNSVYTQEEYLKYIQPIFHTLLLSRYDLELTQAQMSSVYNDLWNTLTNVSTNQLPSQYDCYIYTGHRGNLKQEYKDLVTEYNKEYQEAVDKDLEEGEYPQKVREPIPWKNKDDEGDYDTAYSCQKIRTDNRETVENNLNENQRADIFELKALGVYISNGNINNLLDKCFNNRINYLSNKGSLTDEENMQLNDLKDNREICMEYIQLADENNGGNGGQTVDLNGVELTEVTSFACQFVGNKYVYGGTDINNGIDCSAFVQYVYAHFGISLPRVASDQCRCGIEVSSLAEAKAGDLIFYSNDGTTNGVYHVTMYLGNGKMVHASNSKPYPQGGIKISNVYGSPYKIKRIAN